MSTSDESKYTFIAEAHVGEVIYERILEAWEVYRSDIFPSPVNGRFAPDIDYVDWAESRMPPLP